MRANLLRVYPEWTAARRLQVERKFYEYLGGLLWDLTRSSLSGKDFGKQNIHWENPELIDDLAKQGRSLVLLTSHFGNWEWIAQGMGSRFEHALWFVYKPIQWKAAEDWLRKWRSRRYVVPVALKELRTRLAAEMPSLTRPVAVYLGADQSPTAQSRWIATRFLGQPTAVYQGPEELCRTYGLTPVWLQIHPLARNGSYSVTFVVPPLDWSTDKHGSLMHWYINSLTWQIHAAPEYWLWTHRRWKLNQELGLDSNEAASSSTFSTGTSVGSSDGSAMASVDAPSSGVI